MDLDFTMEEEQFRAEVRAFLKAKLPARIADKVRTGKRLTKKDHEEWHAILHERGWLASHWPPEYGGPGWITAQAHIFDADPKRVGAGKDVFIRVNLGWPRCIQKNK